MVVLLVTLTGGLTLGLGSCKKDNELKIQKDFPFEVNVMPVPKEVANGLSVELRITILPSANYSGAEYHLRYCQFDGQGMLQYNDEPPYKPNNLYFLTAKQFRLYYTSASTVSQYFEVWISDGEGNEKQLSFQLAISNKE
jgi:hypothetical protein